LDETFSEYLHEYSCNSLANQRRSVEIIIRVVAISSLNLCIWSGMVVALDILVIVAAQYPFV